MCSFLFSNNRYNGDIDEINKFLKPRGPDHTEITEFNGCLFLHNLLSITGEFTPQPFVSDNIVVVYNGEIYNYSEFGSYNSDGECLIELYKQYGSDFIKKLDGEFAICLVDFNKELLVLSSDIFKTKPIFYGFNGSKLGVSTYRTPLDKMGYTTISVEPNSIYEITLTGKILSKKTIYEFDLNQHKKDYNDWITAFSEAIKKRITNTNKNVFIGLSSGYDSGIIYNELLKNEKNFYTFSLTGTENQEIIDKRLALAGSNCISEQIQKNDSDYSFSHLLICKNTEPFQYTIPNENRMLTTDDGANNFATICRKAKRKNCKICLSGTGADEIISDYGHNGNKFFPHSNFGGKFPDDLSSIFPWASFYGSTLESYIAKEEYVGGSFGIEMRYPFLDKQVVQEFLWLTAELKNKFYKAPIHEYFTLHNFPFEINSKRGF